MIISHKKCGKLLPRKLNFPYILKAFYFSNSNNSLLYLLYFINYQIFLYKTVVHTMAYIRQ